MPFNIHSEGFKPLAMDIERQIRQIVDNSVNNLNEIRLNFSKLIATILLLHEF